MSAALSPSSSLACARAPAREEPVIIRLVGPPQGKNRHRSRIASSKDGRQFIRNFSDPKTASYEARIRAAAAEAMSGRPLLSGAVEVAIWAYRAVPTSLSRKNTALALAGQIRPTTKPDVDNYAKVIDALNGIVWVDDALVVQSFVAKLFAEAPSLVIRVQPWTPPLPVAAGLLPLSNG